MLRMPKRVIVCGFASVSSFATFTFPAYSAASWSTTGAMRRHGPHHVAQKSTTATPACCSISARKSASVTTFVFSLIVSFPPDRIGRVSCRCLRSS